MFKNYELVHKLMAKGWHITTAESCTGGMISSSIVDVPDASKVFDMAFVTYADEAKSLLIAVNKLSIKQHGVVSEVVAKEMATGAAKKARAEVAVATTGIAGPSGGTPDKPVGTVCFGFYVNGNVITKTMHFEGNREKVRTAATNFAFETLLELLN